MGLDSDCSARWTNLSAHCQRVERRKRCDEIPVPQIGSVSACDAPDLVRRRSYFFDFFFLPSASRSLFFRRLARFLALSLPLLCPMSPTVIYSCLPVTL